VPSRKRHKKIEKHNRKETKSGIGKKVLAAIGTIATAFGILEAALYFWPGISVSVADLLVPSDQFSVVFQIDNSGVLPVYHVDVWYHFRNAQTKGIGPNRRDVFAVSANAQVPILRRGEHLTLQAVNVTAWLPKIPNAPLIERDFIEVNVVFQPFLAWFHLTKVFPFIAKQDESGQWHWFAEPESSTRPHEGIPFLPMAPETAAPTATMK